MISLEYFLSCFPHMSFVWNGLDYFLFSLEDVLSCFQHMDYSLDYLGGLVERFPAHGFVSCLKLVWDCFLHSFGGLVELFPAHGLVA